VDVDKTSSHRKTLKRPTKMFNRKIQYDAEDDRDDKYQV
jgi:hypothetical protein